MTRWLIVSGLLVLNLVLGAGVYQALGVEQPAKAQIGAAKANIAEVAGIINNQTVIYLLDTDSGQLLAVRMNITGKRFELVGKRDVAADLHR
jgi:hypothetical protein